MLVGADEDDAGAERDRDVTVVVAEDLVHGVGGFDLLGHPLVDRRRGGRAASRLIGASRHRGLVRRRSHGSNNPVDALARLNRTLDSFDPLVRICRDAAPITV